MLYYLYGNSVRVSIFAFVHLILIRAFSCILIYIDFSLHYSVYIMKIVPVVTWTKIMLLSFND